MIITVTLVNSGINATASYFGDPVLSREQINGLADDILQSSNSFEYYRYILMYIVNFILVSYQ